MVWALVVVKNWGSCVNWVFNLRTVGLIKDDVQLSLLEDVHVSTPALKVDLTIACDGRRKHTHCDDDFEVTVGKLVA